MYGLAGRKRSAEALDILNFKSALTMLGIVQAGDFIVLFDPQTTRYKFCQIGYDKGADRRKGRCPDNGQKLHPQLSGISVKEPSGAFRNGGVREDAGGQRSPDTTQTVNTESIQGIVVSQHVFQFGNADITEQTSQASDNERGRHVHKARGRGDCYGADLWCQRGFAATTPEARPRTVGLRVTAHSAPIQASAPMAAEVLVTRKADPATPSAAS